MKNLGRKLLILLVCTVSLTTLRDLQADCCPCTPLTQANFASGTFQITAPGKYCFASDISVAAQSGKSALDIQSDNVTVDLCGFTFKQSNSVSDVSGIASKGHFKNITIKNGSIQNFTGQAIYFFNTAPTIGAFETLSFEDLSISQCGETPSLFLASGIDLEAIDFTVVSYKSVSIKRCKVNRCTGNAAISINQGDDISIEDTQADETKTSISPFGFIAGYALVNNSNVRLTNCTANDTQNTDPVGAEAIGLFSDGSTNLQCTQCQFNTSFSSNGGAFNAFFGGNTNVILTDTQFNNALSSGTTADSTDGAFFSVCSGIQAYNCQFNDNFGQGAATVAGIEIQSVRDSVFKNCQFNRSKGGQDSTLVLGINQFNQGTEDDETSGVTFLNCQFNSASRESTTPGTIAGTFLETSKNISLENCQATNLLSTGPNQVYGFMVKTAFASPVSVDSLSVRNVTFKNCIASDLVGTMRTIGFAAAAESDERYPVNFFANFTFENCIAERIQSSTTTDIVAGIGEFLIPETTGLYPHLTSLFIKNCRVVDVESTGTKTSELSSGIFIQSISFPNLCDNTVSACDRGIFLTGSCSISPNVFQLAATKNGSQKTSPNPLPIAPLFTVTTNRAGVGPYTAAIALYSPLFSTPVSGIGAVTSPLVACTALSTPLQGKIGVCRSGSCITKIKTASVENAGGIGTIIFGNLNPPLSRVKTSPFGNGPTVFISNSDGNELVSALQSDPTIRLTISGPGLQTFTNLDRNNSVDVHVQTDVNGLGHYINPTEDLNTLGWQTGDRIYYDARGTAPISGLANKKTYYLIVYRPGFTEEGLFKQNSVDNCSVAGFVDKRCPTTSAFLSNTAFNNGTPSTHAHNYEINWTANTHDEDPIPVCEGDLAHYPDCKTPLNISLIPACKYQEDHRCNRCGRNRR